MTSVAFDTLKFVRALRDKAKMSPEQAEGFADAISEAVQNDLATKADIREVKTEIRDIRTSLDASEARTAHKLDLGLAELRSETKLLEQRMTVKFGTMLAAAVGILVAAMRYMPPR